jgi:TetR/AcrR family transcriptional repressor of lmrAB and yxaGH operons
MKDKIISTMGELLETQGYHGTGLNQLVAASGAPKGSLYHYFPGGKDQIVVAALRQAEQELSARIRENLRLNPDPGAGMSEFVRQLAGFVEASGFRAGGPLLTVASETATTNDSINAACREAYQGLIAAIDDQLRGAGLASPRSTALATTLAAALEGGILLARTMRSTAPLIASADFLEKLVAQAFYE